MINNYIQFISNIVKGLQSLEKRIKVFEYLKNCISNNGFMFLQETNSTVFDEKRWQDELKGKLFFPHGHSDSYGVAIGFLGNMNFNVLNKIQDKDRRILILDVQVGDATFLLINLYNAICEQLNVLTTLCNFLSKITDFHCKNIIFDGDFNVFFDTNYEAQGGNPTLKKKSITKLIHIKLSLEHCDI